MNSFIPTATVDLRFVKCADDVRVDRNIVRKEKARQIIQTELNEA